MPFFGTLQKTPNDQKFAELILYVCRQSEGDAPFGAVKLNKILFYSDFIAYLQFGEAITWQPYRRLKNGPVPKRLLPVVRRMEQKGDLAPREVQYYGRTKRQYCALRDPDLSSFGGEEIALVDRIIKECWGKNAKAMSDMSHAFKGWQQAKDGETIPYQVALARFERPTKDQLAQGAEMADELRDMAGDLLDEDD
jgi:hypothetical protein